MTNLSPHVLASKWSHQNCCSRCSPAHVERERCGGPKVAQMHPGNITQRPGSVPATSRQQRPGSVPAASQQRPGSSVPHTNKQHPDTDKQHPDTDKQHSDTDKIRIPEQSEIMNKLKTVEITQGFSYFFQITLNGFCVH